MAAKELTNNTYLFQFFHEIDVQRVLDNGPWSFEQSLLVLAKVQPDTPPLAMALDTTDFWVQVHDLPLGFFSEKAVRAIGNFIGEFLSIDEDTNNGWWKSFVRIRVRIKILKPLTSKMRIRRNGGDWSWISFKYERLPHFCFTCGLIGHTENYCSKPFEDFNPAEEKQFGPWLRAPSRRPSPVTGNRWVVLDDSNHNTTTTLNRQGQDVAADTGAAPGQVRTDVHCTSAHRDQHVATSFCLHPTTNDPVRDATMEQMDPSSVDDGLTIVDSKRKRTVFDGLSVEPSPSFIDLNGPEICPKNLLRAGPVTQASPEQ